MTYFDGDRVPLRAVARTRVGDLYSFDKAFPLVENNPCLGLDPRRVAWGADSHHWGGGIAELHEDETRETTDPSFIEQRVPGRCNAGVDADSWAHDGRRGSELVCGTRRGLRSTSNQHRVFQHMHPKRRSQRHKVTHFN